ncbi:neuroglobin-1 [Nematostella vectensis]|uniref:neuroglobin-1 n=1 Tax=Nematostella vectensis TaxID=45351 RepID=UPI0020775C20|nr:neuroglobin-1 [Nematostella vectensis]
MGCGASSTVRPFFIRQPASDTENTLTSVPLSTRRKKLVRESWELIEPVKITIGKRIFTRLFDVNPNMQDTFPNFKGKELKDILNSRSLYLHAKRVMVAVENAVTVLDDAETFESYLINLGGRHLPWGVTKDHFGVVGEAFIWALQDVLGEGCTSDVAEAWIDLYGYIVQAMLEGLQQAKKGR